MTTVTSSGRETSYRSERGERFGGGCSDDDATAAEAEEEEGLPPLGEEVVVVVVGAVRGAVVGRSGNGVAIIYFDQPSHRKDTKFAQSQEQPKKERKETELN